MDIDEKSQFITAPCHTHAQTISDLHDISLMSYHTQNIPWVIDYSDPPTITEVTFHPMTQIPYKILYEPSVSHDTSFHQV